MMLINTWAYLWSVAVNNLSIFADLLKVRETQNTSVPSPLASNMAVTLTILIHLDFEITSTSRDDGNEWKHFPRYWPFSRLIHWSPVDSPHKGQWRGVWKLSLISVWTSNWANNGDAGDLRRHQARYDVIVMRLRPCIAYNSTITKTKLNSHKSHRLCMADFQFKVIFAIKLLFDWSLSAQR